MGKEPIGENFLLENKTAEKLYHEYAESLPLIDFHNHINPFHIAENIHFENISQLWIASDPYKHRAMRICGFPEEGITGNIPDKQKFLNWAKVVPQTIGNPLFHWTCLELKRVFGIGEILTGENAEKIWNICNEKLQDKNSGARDILEKWNIELLCTSDSLADSLIPHRKLSGPEAKTRMLPSLRGDSLLEPGSSEFLQNIHVLSELSGIHILNLETYKAAMVHRLDFFMKSGCLLSDHSLDSGFTFSLPEPATAALLFSQVLRGEFLSGPEMVLLKSYLLKFLGEEYCRRGWAMQLHIGAHRTTSSRLRKLAGPAGGFACIGNTCDVESLVRFLDSLEKDGLLPRVILYTLNPSDNEVLASLTGSFAQDGVAGKIQMGPAWWFNDHYGGIVSQLTAISGYGLLSRFIGMTTDSRSILSFSRHEYFRRILCNLLGNWVERGQIPPGIGLLGELVGNVSYHNAKNWISDK
jgi:glucuronate isomerase